MKQAKSNKQTGRITTNKVHIHRNYSAESKPPKSKKGIIFIIAAIFTIIAGIIAVLIYFGLSPINMNQRSRDSEYDKFHVDVSNLEPSGDMYKRSIKIRNNTKYPQNNVHISIQGTKVIKPLGTPWPEGGGMIMIQYIKSKGKTYETEIGTIPANKYVKIILASSEPFEVEVKIYWIES